MGLYGSEIVDPALLVLTKEAKRATKGSRRTSSSRRSNSQDEDDSFDDSGGGDDWESTIETFVEDLCTQMRSAARASSSPAESGSTDARPPFRLHPRANVVAQLHVRWPDQLDPKWAGVPIAPLELHYVRIEEEEQKPRTVMNLYTRQLSRADKHDLSGGGMWLDDLNRRERRSIDVRITSEDGGDLGLGSDNRTRNSGGTRTTEFDPYVIEVLSVAIAPEEEKTEPDATEQARATSR